MTLEQQIEETQKQLSALQKQLEQEDKLELKGGDGYALNTHFGIRGEALYSVNGFYVKRGAFRATKELAEIADKNMVARNKLEAYVHQIQGDGEGRCLLYIANDGTYRASNQTNYRPYLGTVYMQKETAEILCKALNANEIEL